MDAYDDARAAVEALWADNIADTERIEVQAGRRVREAEARVAELRAEIAECGRGIGAARTEMGGMGERITTANLEGDDGEVLAVQGRHAELRSLLEGLEKRAAAAHTSLANLTGGTDPDAFLANVRDEARAEVEAARYKAEWRARREFEELRERLEERRAAVAGGRSPEARVQHEQRMAAGERPDGTPPHVRQAERAAERVEEQRQFEETRRRVDAARERERERARTDQRRRLEQMGIPVDRIVR